MAVFVVTSLLSGTPEANLWSLVTVALFAVGVFAHRRRFTIAMYVVAAVVTLTVAVAAALV